MEENSINDSSQLIILDSLTKDYSYILPELRDILKRIPPNESEVILNNPIIYTVSDVTIITINRLCRAKVNSWNIKLNVGGKECPVSKLTTFWQKALVETLLFNQGIRRD